MRMQPCHYLLLSGADISDLQPKPKHGNRAILVQPAEKHKLRRESRKGEASPAQEIDTCIGAVSCQSETDSDYQIMAASGMVSQAANIMKGIVRTGGISQSFLELPIRLLYNARQHSSRIWA